MPAPRPMERPHPLARLALRHPVAALGTAAALYLAAALSLLI